MKGFNKTLLILNITDYKDFKSNINFGLDLSILTLNLEYLNKWKTGSFIELEKQLNRHKPDIICVQEGIISGQLADYFNIQKSVDNSLIENKKLDNYKLVFNSDDSEYSKSVDNMIYSNKATKLTIRSELLDKNLINEIYISKECLKNYEIENYGVLKTSSDIIITYENVESKLAPRSAVFVTLKYKKKPDNYITIFSTHISGGRFEDTNYLKLIEERKNQIIRIKSFFAEKLAKNDSHTSIIVGDFNSTVKYDDDSYFNSIPNAGGNFEQFKQYMTSPLDEMNKNDINIKSTTFKVFDKNNVILTLNDKSTSVNNVYGPLYTDNDDELVYGSSLFGTLIDHMYINKNPKFLYRKSTRVLTSSSLYSPILNDPIKKDYIQNQAWAFTDHYGILCKFSSNGKNLSDFKPEDKPFIHVDENGKIEIIKSLCLYLQHNYNYNLIYDQKHFSTTSHNTADTVFYTDLELDDTLTIKSYINKNGNIPMIIYLYDKEKDDGIVSILKILVLCFITKYDFFINNKFYFINSNNEENKSFKKNNKIFENLTELLYNDRILTENYNNLYIIAPGYDNLINLLKKEKLQNIYLYSGAFNMKQFKLEVLNALKKKNIFEMSHFNFIYQNKNLEEKSKLYHSKIINDMVDYYRETDIKTGELIYKYWTEFNLSKFHLHKIKEVATYNNTIDPVKEKLKKVGLSFESDNNILKNMIKKNSKLLSIKMYKDIFVELTQNYHNFNLIYQGYLNNKIDGVPADILLAFDQELIKINQTRYIYDGKNYNYFDKKITTVDPNFYTEKNTTLNINTNLSNLDDIAKKFLLFFKEDRKTELVKEKNKENEENFNELYLPSLKIKINYGEYDPKHSIKYLHEHFFNNLINVPLKSQFIELEQLISKNTTKIFYNKSDNKFLNKLFKNWMIIPKQIEINEFFKNLNKTEMGYFLTENSKYKSDKEINLRIGLLGIVENFLKNFRLKKNGVSNNVAVSKLTYNAQNNEQNKININIAYIEDSNYIYNYSENYEDIKYHLGNQIDILILTF